MNITPSQINSLKPNEIFVFGSNLDGNHAGGAARFAVMKFGAEMGNGIGLQGQSYAIPTLSRPAFRMEDLEDIKLPIEEIGQYVKAFIGFAQNHQDMYFYVTPIGCGIAGFKESEIAPLFKECINMENVALPQSFVDILQVNQINEKKIIKENFIKILKMID